MRSAIAIVALVSGVAAATAAAILLWPAKDETPPPAQTATAPGDLPALPQIRSAADFAATYPDRMGRLLARLDLDHAGLEAVKEAHQAGDLGRAAEALARYYRQTGHGGWLKQATGVHDPGGYDDYTRMAPRVLADTYSFQGVAGTARRLDNGRLDWAYRGPRDDLQWALFLNRHFHLIPLIKAYHASPDPAHARKIDETFQDWVTSNWPPAEGVNDKALPANWRPMTTASRFLQVWPQAFYFLQGEVGLSDAARLMMLSSVPEQADHLLRYHRRRHNHAVKEMIGLSHAAAAWPEFAGAPAWRAYALGILTEELDHQIYPSGVQKELAAHYHRTVLEYLLQYVQFMRAAGFPAPPAFETRIETMGDYLAHAMRPSGTIPLNNDSDLDDVRGLVLTLAGVFDRPDWRHIATNGTDGQAPSGPASRFHPYAGQLISRSGWDDGADWSFFDVGPYGISHQHRDRLHLSITSGGRDLLVDTGRYVYKRGDPFRDYVVSSRSHNLVLVDGRGQNQQYPERDRPMADAAAIKDTFDIAFGVFDEGFEGVEGQAVHRRAMAYIKGLGWIVADDIETDRPRALTPLWHFHPDLAVDRDGASVVGAGDAGAGVRVTPVGPADMSVRIARGETDPVLGWYSPVYNVRYPAAVAVFDAAVDASVTFGWVITTTADGRPAPVDVTRLPAPDGALRLRVQAADGRVWEVAVRLRGDGPVDLSNGDRLDGRFAMIDPDGAIEVAGGVISRQDGSVRKAHQM